MMDILCNQCRKPFYPKNGLRDWICPVCAEKNRQERIDKYNRIRRERDMMKKMVMSYE